MSYEQILVEVPSLTKQQMLELDKRLKVLIKLTKDDIINSQTKNDWLLNGIILELHNRGLTTPPLSKVYSLQSFNSYQENSKDIRELFENHIPNLNRREKQYFGRLLARCLAEHISSFSEINLHSLLKYISFVTEAFEKSFPSYLSCSGLLIFMVRGLTKESIHGFV